MTWVERFYSKQHEWTGIYAEPIGTAHREKAALVEQLGRVSPLRVLELGCGGGQVARATADRGHTVLAIDLNDHAIDHARRLAATQPYGRMTVLQDDFHTVEVKGTFDVVCCFDGFGIGEDEDQRRLLRRIAGWLAPDGRALIEVYTPWYWAAAAGRSMAWPDASRRYDYDTASNRMLDTWWPTDDPPAAVTQSLACYGPDDLRILIETTGLTLTGILPGGAYDHVADAYRERVPLSEAMQYVAVLERA
jgi:SAM-dependent methyltransferase